MNAPFWLFGGGATSGGGGLPPRLTRAQMLDWRLPFQGVTINSQQYGRMPAVNGSIGVLNAEDRLTEYRALLAYGANRAMINVTGAYFEPVPHPLPGCDMSRDLGRLKALVREQLTNGFGAVQVMLGGDGQSKPRNPDGTYPYNDPVGWTYGHDWLMDNVARIDAGFGPTASDPDDLRPWIVPCPGYDGIFTPDGGWTPEQVKAYWRLIRSIVGPDRVTAFEWSAKYMHLGDGKATYTSDEGRMNDIWLYEFPTDAFPAGPWIWQIASRALGPNYKRAPDQPADEDPGAPFAAGSGNDYLSEGTPRGPFLPVGWEYDTGKWTRDQLTAADVDTHRRYMTSLGWPRVG